MSATSPNPGSAGYQPAGDGSLPSRTSVRVSLYIEAPDDTALTEWAIQQLCSLGYYVAAPGALGWEKPGDFCRRIGIRGHKLGDLLTRYDLRGGAPVLLDRRGKSGRIAALQSNPQFDAFCRSLRRNTNQTKTP